MPSGYQRLGRVLLLRLPERYRPYFPLLGSAWREELGVATVLTQVGPVEGELRRPRVERIAGDGSETEVVEHGIRWRFDAGELMFAAGNRTERQRAGRLVRPQETVVDLFAGIGYFAIPAAVVGRARRVVAVEKNPLAYRYLLENAERNSVADRIDGRLGDNRTVPIERGAAERVFLGFLPDAVPWIPRAIELLRPGGGWLHVHTVADARGALDEAITRVSHAATAGGASRLEPLRAREVKPYGPGRTHVVVDARLRPPI
jgi:tRNA wybutosine-synthesizing protein 2